MKMFVKDEAYGETRQFETDDIKQVHRQGARLYVEYKDGTKDFLSDEGISAQRSLKNMGDAMKFLKGKIETGDEEFKGLCQAIGTELEVMIKNAGLASHSVGEQRELHLRNDGVRTENFVGCGNPV